MSKTVLIFSGGLDSTCLLYKLLADGDEVRTLSFDYGQRHRVELERAKAITEKAKVPNTLVDLSMLAALLPGSSQTDPTVEVPDGKYDAPNMKLTVVPNRNMIMLSIAVGHAIAIGFDRVAYAAHAGDHTIYPDCRPEFVHDLNVALQNADWKYVPVYAPFLALSKGGCVKQVAGIEVPFELTWSCYKGFGAKHCGKCGACTERQEAFAEAGIKDPTEYEAPLSA